MFPLPLRRLLLQTILLVCCACLARTATVFQDGFESGRLGSAWTVSTTNNGRVTVTTDYTPAAGQYHLVFDDSVNDAIYSVAQATLSLDLSNKKNVVLVFQAKSLGNEPDAPPSGNFTGNAAFDGVSVSVDGGKTWRAATSLATVGTSWQVYNIALDSVVAALGGSYNANTLIRFSEYDNSPVPIDGIAIDEVSVTADQNLIATLDMPSPVSEGGGTYTGYALLSVAPTKDAVVTLTPSDKTQLSLPASVTVPAGQTSASFTFSVVDNTTVDFGRTVTVTPACTGYTGTALTLTVYDNETVNLSLSLPAQLTEGQYTSSNASVSIDRAGVNPLTVSLSANPSNELSLPSSVTIPAGSTQAVFTVQAADDNRIDGNQLVTVTASATGLTSATAQTTTIDNEVRSLAIKSNTTTVQEGSSTTGTVTLGGTLTTAVTVYLTSSNPATATVPTSVIVAAGATQATFPIIAPDNSVRDGSRSVTLTATADTFSTGLGSVIVRDNEPAGYRISGVPDIVNVGGTLSITVAAADIEGNAISGYTGTANLSLVLPDGTTQAVTPAQVSISGTTGWTGSVTLPAVNAIPLRLRATGAGGLTGDSVPFDTMRAISLTVNDVVWDATRSRLYASVASTDTSTHANQVVSIDPTTLQITGAVTIGNNPGQLALTSAGEQLYVALNGNGSIARISPDSMTVNQTFSLGSDSYYGTCYANDITTVAGQPNVLIVARKVQNVSPSYVVPTIAYDNGVARSKTLPGTFTGINRLEPSADPTLFFAYNNETTGYDFQQIKLDSTGLTSLVDNGNLLGGFYLDIRSTGNTVFATSGVKLDGAQQRVLGSFSVVGPAPVCPDPAANRVYYAEVSSTYSTSFTTISAFDPNTFAAICKLSLPSGLAMPFSASTKTTSFLRWGGNGLALRTDSAIVLINSTRLVPTDAAANLNVQVQTTPNPARVTSPLTYFVTVTNHGPNSAANTQVTATLSSGQTITGVSATAGTPSFSGLTVTLPVGSLANGGSAVLTVTALPQSAGSASCTASVTSNAVDPDASDNLAVASVSVGFKTGPDAINSLRLAANNLVYDTIRGVLWTSLPATADAPLSRSVVAVDPLTGLVSAPIALNANPTANCMALSGNGQYLYVGLSDSPEVARLDLSASPPTVTRIPLGINQWDDASYANDIEVLDGDGTSFLLTSKGDDAANVYDGAVRRANRTAIYSVSRLARTSTAGTFVGYDTNISDYPLTTLVVNSAGVTASQTKDYIIGGYADISGGGNATLTSNGYLINNSTLTILSNLGVSGRQCLDAANGRAYLVNGSSLRAFDSATGLATGSLALPVTLTGDWALNCVRWGLDGFAILGSDGNIYIARSSSTIPASVDTNGNGIPDAWEATWFNSLTVNMAADSDGDGVANALEYLFATSPTQASASPVQAMGMTTNASGQNVMHLVFPRRSGLGAAFYGYQISSDLVHWTAAQTVAETVLSTQTVGGVSVDTVQADVTLPGTAAGYVRLEWLGSSNSSNVEGLQGGGRKRSGARKTR